MWQHDYQPVGDSLFLSAIVAALPLLALFYMLGIRRKPSWIAALVALGTALVVALFGFGMPLQLAVASTIYGAAFGMFPIAWIVFASILLYRLTVDTGKFEIIKDTVGGLTNDRRLQALFIAFAFGAFVEGAAGFGAPVAVAAAMLAGLGFSPFYAAGICLLANTAPVAFGSIGVPITTLAGITNLPVGALSAMVGRICALVSVIIPAYLVVIMAGVGGAIEVLPAIATCGLTFATMQFLVSNYFGPELTDILSSLTAIAAMIVLMKVWHPRKTFRLEGDTPIAATPKKHPGKTVFMAVSAYLLLVVFVLVWGYPTTKAQLDKVTIPIQVPGLHQMIEKMPPVTNAPEVYNAVFTFNWLSATGTSCILAAMCAALLLGVGPGRFWGIYKGTAKQLSYPMLTIATVLGLAYLMNYSGMTSTLGLAFAGTGKAFPFFSSILGWMGVFLTGSDTSANALFGNLQVVTAKALGINPVLTAAVNSSGGVMGKMISLSSIAVAVAATGMHSSDEGKLFRLMLKHSILLASVIGVIAMGYAYLVPQFIPVVATP